MRFVAFVLICPFALSSGVARQAVTVEDLARQTIVGDPNTLSWNDIATRVSARSPDGKYVAVVIRRGNPEGGTNDADLLVYETAELMSSPRPRVLASFASATNYQPIALVRWLPDNKTLVFAGTAGSDPSQVYQVRVDDSEVIQLTREHSPLEWFDITPSGKWLVTASEPAPQPIAQDPECLKRGCLVTAETLSGAEQGLKEIAAPLTRYDRHSGESRTLTSPEALDSDLLECRDDLKGGLSPDGRFGLRICKVRSYRWPSWWSEYTVHPELQEALRLGVNGYLRQWVLIDFDRNESIRLGSYPYYMGHLVDSAPIWIDGGKRVLIAGALESLLNVSKAERARRASHYSIVAVDPITRRVEHIASMSSKILRMTDASWDENSQTLRVESLDASSNPLPVFGVRRRGSRWDVTSEPAGAPHVDLPDLVIEQSLNTPQMLMAVNPRTGAKALVLDPNPWLKERLLARVEPISWASKDGRQWRGGLYYPPNYVAGHRYAVVLQTHGFEAQKFSLYGAARNFAAQPLAALGMLVLQIDENIGGIVTGPAEWPAVQAGYEGAIDYLDKQGLIDRQRVGILGWSRSGSYAGYSLTHSRYPFAAVAFTETADFGWWWYLTQGARHGESAYGAPPLGDGLDLWRRMSPSFNLEHVNAPVLMWTSGVTALWDWYVVLRRLKKPVEYWSLPDATHDVFKLPQRMHTNQLVVDWFRFWLKNEEDPDLAKTAQYIRWREFRPRQP